MPTEKRSTSNRPPPQRRSLPLLPGSEPAPLQPDGRRHPAWIKARLPSGENFFNLQSRVQALGLHTVCQSASCPNIGECWNDRNLTIMILGGTCTRSCQFCDVPNGRPDPVEPDEPERVAKMLGELHLRHTVITSVDRDDLADGGAAHWAATIRAVKRACPEMTLEVLTGDFVGNLADVDTVLDERPHIFSHNLETVPRLSRQVRVQARYDRSLAVLAHAVAHPTRPLTKTGIMLGLGETIEEVEDVLAELGRIGVRIVTLGQYLAPSRTHHLPVARYATPEEFVALKQRGLALGIQHVEAGPMVRSSYHADQQARQLTGSGPTTLQSR